MRTCLLMLLVLLLSIADPLLGAESWNQFRGPGGDGQAGSKSLPVEWNEAEGVSAVRAHLAARGRRLTDLPRSGGRRPV